MGPFGERIVLVSASSFGLLLLFGVFSSAAVRKLLERGVFSLCLLLSPVTGQKHELFLIHPDEPEFLKLTGGCIEGSV